MDTENGSTIKFSPYLVLEHTTERINSGGGGNSPPPASPVPLQHLSCQITHISLVHACKAVISCIKSEKGLYGVYLKYYYNHFGMTKYN